MSIQMFEINSEDELKKTIESNKDNLIVLFTSPTCPPCLMLEPIMDELIDNKICSVAKINVLENQDLASKYDVSATPTSFIIKNNEIKKVVLGYKPFDSWKQIIETL